MKAKNNTPSVGGHLIKMPSLTFLVCIGISVLLWVFYTLSHEYTVSYAYKVECTDLPEGRSEAMLSDSAFTLVFKSKGFTFLNPKFHKSHRTLTLSVNQLLEHKGYNLNSYRFTKNEIKDYIKDNNLFENYFVDVKTPYEVTIYLSK